jgi:hypothetical protein
MISKQPRVKTASSAGIKSFFLIKKYLQTSLISKTEKQA